jgi:hypothetical protein
MPSRRSRCPPLAWLGAAQLGRAVAAPPVADASEPSRPPAARSCLTWRALSAAWADVWGTRQDWVRAICAASWPSGEHRRQSVTPASRSTTRGRHSMIIAVGAARPGPRCCPGGESPRRLSRVPWPGGPDTGHAAPGMAPRPASSTRRAAGKITWQAAEMPERRPGRRICRSCGCVTRNHSVPASARL